MRLAHTQVWPAFLYFEAITPLTAASISASSKRMNGALPPNSNDNFLTVPAHCSISNLPISVEPVIWLGFVSGSSSPASACALKLNERRTYWIGSSQPVV
jgi:hypothetical protein